MNWQVGFGVVIKIIAQICNYSWKVWLFYLVVQTNRLLDTNWWAPLMCNEIEMLFSIIRVVNIWCLVWYIG